MSKIIKTVLMFALIIGSILVVSVPFSSAQDSTKFTISGYILDASGNGLEGTNIIFNVPSIVPSVFSDSSGYYEIFAPQGTYNINVWPAFDSSYIFYEEMQFSVESDITKNITLTLGNKVSGFVLDTEGNPVNQASVTLGNYLVGWYSNYSGYYFCTVPDGTYDLTVIPRRGNDHFSVYKESNVVVNGDVTKNIVVSNHTATQILPPAVVEPSDPQPPVVVEPSEPQPAPTSADFYDNFNDGVADGWTQHEGSWNVVNGEYCTSVGVVDDAVSTVNGLSYMDCTIETTFRFTDSVGFRAGIVFRFIDPTHYYGLHISNEYDSVGISKYTPQYTEYGEGLISLKGNIFQSNTDYHLKVVVAGEWFICYVNGEQMFVINDDSYAYGGVGLRARRADVCFDNFIVDNATDSDIELPEPISEELVAWWKLEEGNGTVVSDSSGYLRQGTINGANWLKYQGENALNFDGKSDYVSLPSLNLANLDSLTVVAWINSDLTKVGYIYAHGDNGVFELSNGHFSDAHITEIKTDHARFGVKLYPSGWYDAFSSYPLEPNRWHQLVGVWVKGDSVKVYVDGVLAGEVDNIPSEPLEDAGTSFPSSLGTYSQNRWKVDTFFKGQISNAMVFNTVMTPSQVDALYDVSVPVVPRPSLDVSCESASSPHSSLNIEINGKLTISENGIINAPIMLSYSINGGKSWQDLTMVNTLSDGTYSATWNPQVTGIYMINAVYEGGVDYLPASAAMNYSVTQDKEQNVFSVNSNSTVSSLAFNSTSRTLSFSVTGASGTTGYVDVSFSKTLVSNIEEVRVLLDLNQLERTIIATEDSWHIHFQYQHSTHNIVIDLGTNQQVAEFPFGNWTYYVAVIASLAIVIIIYIKRSKNKKEIT